MTPKTRAIRPAFGLLLLALAAWTAGRASAQDRPGSQGPPGYRVTWFPDTPIRSRGHDWELVAQDLSLACPLWTNASHTVLMTASVRNRLISSGETLPDSLLPYPGELWNVQAGVMESRRLEGNRMIAGGVSLGSASDDPFASSREVNLNVNALYRTPSRERHAWLFMLMYAPTGEIPFPLPTLAYSYKPSDQFQANLGLPFSFRYKPSDAWTLEASYMLIHTVRARATCRLNERLSVFAGYDWLNEVYRLHDRANEDDRFFLYHQCATLGVAHPVASRLTAELSGGYAFGRYSFVGRQMDSDGDDHVGIDPGPFVSLSLRLRR